MKNEIIKLDKESETEDLHTINESENKNSDEVAIVKPSECENEENMDTALIQERRISQNSELNNEHRDSTPMQTDTEEVSNI